MMMKTARKLLAAILCALLLLPACAGAELNGWPEQMTFGQLLAQEYFDRVNENLAQLSASPVNSMFECYSGFLSLGVTAFPDADIPEGTELVLLMRDSGLQKLTIHTRDMSGFPALAAACIEAASQGTITLEDAMKEPAAYAKSIASAPDNSISNVVYDDQGDTVRTYYNYMPNEFNDGQNWMTMTLIFPWGGTVYGVLVTPTPPPAIDYGNEYEGSNFNDGYNHLDIVTPVPQAPDDGIIR